MKVVRSSASRNGRLYPQEVFLVPISLGLSRPQGHCTVGRNMSLKNPVTAPGIELGTFRLVAQSLNHYATPGPCLYYYLAQKRCLSTTRPNCRVSHVRCTQLQLSACELPDHRWGPPSLLWLRTSFPAGVQRPEREADKPPPGQCRNRDWLKLYLHAPCLHDIHKDSLTSNHRQYRVTEEERSVLWEGFDRPF